MPEKAEEDIARIARACDVDPAFLAAQYSECYLHAELEFRAAPKNLVGETAHQDSMQAWKRSLEKLEGRHTDHRLDTLRQALILYFAFAPSSSGVEQAFSKGAWSFHARRQKAKPATEEFHLKVTLDKDLYSLEDVIPRAQLVWSLCYGHPRERHAARVDKGIKRLWAQKEGSEA